MVGASTATWWVVGWIVGGAVVFVAAALLLAIIGLARRITREAGAIVLALDGARASTEPLFDLANVNYSLEQITRALHGALDPEPNPNTESGDRGMLGRIARRVRSLREGEDS